MPQRPSSDPVSINSDNDERDDPSVGNEVRQTLAQLAPWAISVSAHLLLVVAAVFLVWSTVLKEPDEPWKGEVSIQKAPQVNYVVQEIQRPSEETLRPATSPTIPREVTPEPIMSPIGTGQPFAPSAPQTLPGPTGPQGEGDGVPSGIFGSSGRQTVFVIDASGSLIDTFPIVVNELKSMLARMAVAERERLAGVVRDPGPAFAYAVVFFRDGEVLVQDRRGLRTAHREAVNRTIAWLDRVAPGGATSPLPAIELALSYDPQRIIVLSDNITGHGQYEISADDLIGRVMQVRGDRRIAINTVQFLYPDPQEQYGQRGTLQRLAEQTGGAYRFVSDRELGLR